MAIKDQCEQCRKYNSFCTENIVFNGQSCEQYRKRIDLEKKEYIEDIPVSDSIENTQIDNNIEMPDSNANIHGWLLFMLFSTGVGVVASALIPIYNYNVNEYGGSHILAMVDVLIGIMLLVLSCYTIHAFATRKPNAVFLGKMYTVACFAINLLTLLLNGSELPETGFSSAPQIVRNLMWTIIWFLYLTYSSQVQSIISRSYRKVFSRDYYFMAAFIIIPVLILGIGIGDVQSQHSKKEEEFIKSAKLSHNEYTDGRIIFTKPIGYTCEKQEIKDPRITIFDLNLDERGYIRICIDYETDTSSYNFNSYWKN